MKAFTIFASLVSIAVSVTLPSEDPFYQQPADIASYKPGQVIRIRQVPANLNGFFPGGPPIAVEAAYQYLYATTNALKIGRAHV